MSNKKDLQALAETLVEEFYETQGAGVLKNLNKRTYGNLINGREDVLNSMKESLSDYTDEEGKEIGEKEKEEILHLVDREIWGYGIIDDLIHDKSISDIKIHNSLPFCLTTAFLFRIAPGLCIRPSLKYEKRTHQRPPWHLLFNFRTTLPHQGSAPATSSSRLPAWVGS